MREKAGSSVKIVIEQGDALAIPADVLALKYANSLHGVDRAVVRAIAKAVPDIEDRLPKPGGFHITPAMNAIAAKSVLFVGVGSLRQFGYKEIRAFGRKVLEALAGETPSAEHIALTIHGHQAMVSTRAKLLNPRLPACWTQ